MRKCVVLGAAGQLGRELVRRLGPQAVALTRAEADLTQPAAIRAALGQHRPDIVLNCDAYNLVDRAEADVAELYDPLHPAVLRLVQFATEAALRMRMPVSVCGEMASDPRLTPLLVGLGLRSFSMNASALPRVKQAVRAVMIDWCARFARRVMEQSDPARIQEMVLGEKPS